MQNCEPNRQSARNGRNLHKDKMLNLKLSFIDFRLKYRKEQISESSVTYLLPVFKNAKGCQTKQLSRFRVYSSDFAFS